MSEEETYRLRGIELYHLDRFQDAIQAFEQSLQLDSQNSDSHFWKGHSLFGLSRFQEAIEAYDEAIHYGSMSTGLYAMYVYRGLSYYRITRFSKAIESYSHFLMCDPEAINRCRYYAAGYQRKGNFHYKKACFQEAIEAYDEAIRYDPTRPSVYWEKGKALIRLGLFRDAYKTIKFAWLLYRALRTKAFRKTDY